MIQQTYKCDGCGIAKQQTNHWFLITRHVEGYIIVHNWSGSADDSGVEHYCGAGCLGKAVSLWAAPKNAAAVQPEVLLMVYPY